MSLRKTAFYVKKNRIKEDIEMNAKVMGLLKDEAGQGMVEYGLIIALIAVVVAVALGTMGGNISALFNGISF